MVEAVYESVEEQEAVINHFIEELVKEVLTSLNNEDQK